MKFRITLKRNQEQVILDYETVNHRYVDDWISCFRNSNKIPRQKNRVHGFLVNEEQQKVLAVNDSIYKLNQFYDGLIDRTVSLDNVQDDVNYVHSNFVELHQGRIDSASETNDLWDILNQQLHSCESNYSKSPTIFFEIEDTEIIPIPKMHIRTLHWKEILATVLWAITKWEDIYQNYFLLKIQLLIQDI